MSFATDDRDETFKNATQKRLLQDILQRPLVQLEPYTSHFHHHVLLSKESLQEVLAFIRNPLALYNICLLTPHDVPGRDYLYLWSGYGLSKSGK